MENKVLLGDCAETLKQYPDETFDCIVTDPPYGYSFMNKNWDRALPSLEALKECCRVLKSGAFAFFMSAPRQDVLSRMILRLEEAGFKTGFTSIYWVYASGFPKAAAIDKLIDKRNGRSPDEYKALGIYLKSQRELKGIPQKDIASHFPSKTGGLTGCVSNWELGLNVPTMNQWGVLKELLDLDSRFDELIEREEAEREVIQYRKMVQGGGNSLCLRMGEAKEVDANITAPATDQAKQFEGSFAGFNPKPALEIIIVCMKPLSEKTYVDQALENGHGVTWLGNCRIPYAETGDDWNKAHYPHRTSGYKCSSYKIDYKRESMSCAGGRFPANLLVSDDVLNDGKTHKSGDLKPEYNFGSKTVGIYGEYTRKEENHKGDSGSFSRYFDLDAWFKSKLPEQAQKTYPFMIVPKPSKSEKNKYCENKHPTVKPLKLMSYLITMGSREGDLILDPFAGSGTTCEAARLLNRKFVGCELTEEYLNVLEARAGVKAT